jgi:uncharacterized membrane protein
VRTENSIIIRADVHTIYALAAAIERWPLLLPHYRRVRLLAQSGNRRLVEMAAHRDGFPVRWVAEQTLDPDTPRIIYRHVRGVTTGMEVEWHFVPGDDGVRVGISHHLEMGWPLIGDVVADRIIGPLFVANIASKTLRRIKTLAEAKVGYRHWLAVDG